MASRVQPPISGPAVRRIIQAAAEAAGVAATAQSVATVASADATTAISDAAVAQTTADDATTTADTVYDEVFDTWVSYTPSFAAGAGVITSLVGTEGRYKLIGTTCFFTAQAVININGTGSSEVYMEAPVSLTDASLQLQLFPVRIAPASANIIAGVGIFSGSNTLIKIQKYDATYPGGDGYGIYVGGSYQWDL